MNERAPVIDWSSDFDLLDPRWIQDPYPIWEELRQKCPIAHTDRFSGVYFPTRYEDVRAIAYDSEHFSSRRIFVREGKPIYLHSPPLTSDPPAHRNDRKVLLPAFTPAAVDKLEPWTRSLCRRLLKPLSGKTACDAALEYTQEVPARLTAYMLGLPEHEGDRFRTWIHQFFELGMTEPALIPRVLGEISALFDEQITKRTLAPGNDLVSYLISARVDGQPVSHGDIQAMLRLLLFAGIDTTWNSIGVSLLHLATHDDDRKRLVAEPQLIPTAVEEFLRAYAPATLGREIIKDTEVGGCPFKQGEMVLLPFGAANRDPEKFPDADRVVIDRTENRHAAFGLGAHRCIGSTLARMEIRVALEEWLAVFPDFALEEGAVVEWSPGQLRGPRRLPFMLQSKPES